LERKAVEEEVNWLPLRTAIEAGKTALTELSADVDQTTFKATEESLSRGSVLLHAIWRAALTSFGECPKVPLISPLETGTTDYFWRNAEMSLLINVPAIGFATFAGKRADGKIKGNIDSTTVTPAHLAAWLLNR
jgi:hypothetical protein